MQGTLIALDDGSLVAFEIGADHSRILDPTDADDRRSLILLAQMVLQTLAMLLETMH